MKIKIIHEIKIPSFIGLSINILEIKDYFYTDICYPYSSNDENIIVKDKVNNIYQKLYIKRRKL